MCLQRDVLESCIAPVVDMQGQLFFSTSMMSAKDFQGKVAPFVLFILSLKILFLYTTKIVLVLAFYNLSKIITYMSIIIAIFIVIVIVIVIAIVIVIFIIIIIIFFLLSSLSLALLSLVIFASVLFGIRAYVHDHDNCIVCHWCPGSFRY